MTQRAQPNRCIRFDVSPLEGESLQGPVVAVNWFDLRSACLYRAYTLLAGQRVLHFGGRLLLKASRQGPAQHAHSRKLLLLVKWPDVRSFLAMMEDPLFNLVSPLRMGAVQRFRFGFSRSIAGSRVDPGQPLRQVHLPAALLPAALALVEGGLHIVHAGPQVAETAIKVRSKPRRVLPGVAEAVLTVAGKEQRLRRLDQDLICLGPGILSTPMTSKSL